MRFPVPDGYVRVRHGSASAVVLAPCAPAVASILAHGSLYEWASTGVDARTYRGRGAAYGVSLPECGVRVVVRRARHGGLLAPLLRDVFLAPTRAPRELALSLFFQRVGVRTAPVVAYATYALAPLVRRADVLTQEVPNAPDLQAFLAHNPEPQARAGVWKAAARLLRQLTAVGVWHPDLNARNVLVMPTSGDDAGAEQDRVTYTAFVLDIDRVRLVVPGDPQLTGANLGRLLRSLRKEAGRAGGPQLQEEELATFTALVQAPPGERRHAPA